jgi:hypothetical protein
MEDHERRIEGGCIGANKTLQATAAVLLDSAVDGSHNAVVAGASALPAAVPELGR